MPLLFDHLFGLLSTLMNEVAFFKNRLLGRSLNLRASNITLERSDTPRRVVRLPTSRRMRWAEDLETMEAKINAYEVVAGNPGGKRPLDEEDGSQRK